MVGKKKRRAALSANPDASVTPRTVFDKSSTAPESDTHCIALPLRFGCVAAQIFYEVNVGGGRASPGEVNFPFDFE